MLPADTVLQLEFDKFISFFSHFVSFSLLRQCSLLLLVLELSKKFHSSFEFSFDVNWRLRDFYDDDGNGNDGEVRWRESSNPRQLWPEPSVHEHDGVKFKYSVNRRQKKS